VASVAWSWSPAHSRDDVYHLSTNKHRTHWILWISVYNDVVPPYGWMRAPYAYGPKPGVSPEIAAFYLVLEAWKHEQDATAPFRQIDAEGLLSADDLYLLADLVWPVPS
jgi:hypothetical protein